MPKNDYSLIVFFPDKTVKKWNYVHRLDSFVKFLDSKFSEWTYINVYDRRTREYLRRIRKGDAIPSFIQG